MKKLFKSIKICPLFKNKELKEKIREYSMGYIILFKNGTYKQVYLKDDLLEYLEQDNKKPVRYIFDLTDRIIIDREVKVEEDNGSY